MQWTKGKNAGFSLAAKEKLYLPVDENGVNVKQQQADENSLLNTTKKLIALRKSNKSLCANGEIEFLNTKYNGYPLVYKRFYGSDEFIICINPTDKEQTFEYNFASCEIKMKNKDITVTDSGITLPPVSYIIVKTNKK